MAKKGEKILTRNQVEKLSLNKVSVITADMLDGYTSIGEHAFMDCTNLTSIAIPVNITRIGFAAFCGCFNLTSIEISNSVISIGDYAFVDCSGLPSIAIPNSVISIGYGAFLYCCSLTTITIPDIVISIGAFAFCCCSSLMSAVISNSITNIERCVFEGCRHLASVTIGDKIYKNQVIKDGKCKAYKAFNVNMVCRDFQYKEGETYKFKGNPKLCESGFHACLNLADVFNYYAGKFGKNVVVHEVELEGVSDERRHDSKVVAKKIIIGKRIL